MSEDQCLQGASLRRLYSTFAGGWPGTGLLLLRLVIGYALVVRAASKLWIDPPLNVTIPAVLAIGAGSLMFSHVNDSGFWMFKEYFNLSIKDTIRSWSVMETIVAGMGLAGVLVLNIFVG